MLGVVSAEPVALQPLLTDSKRSLAALSKEHCDGWGIALAGSADWTIEKRAVCAARCETYGALATQARTTHAIAHIRKKTVGAARLANTHPFRRGRYVFAHNGTVPAVHTLRAETSPGRLAEVEGDTDSERLFAFILSCIDRTENLVFAVAMAAAELRRRGPSGAASFLLSDGATMFAFRRGRSLFARTSAETTVVASEPLTNEAWTELAEGSLTMISPQKGLVVVPAVKHGHAA